MPVIATWNVNSVRPRLPQLLPWLSERRPDVLLLQETKVVDDQFPLEALEDVGYNVALYGQKTYNGVAIASRGVLEDVVRGIPDADDPQARYLEALTTLDGKVLRVASVYVPNGQEPDSDKFAYKLQFMDRLRRHAKNLLADDVPTILGGDYNAVFQPEDVYDAHRLEGSVCYHPLERERMRAMVYDGFYDAVRVRHPSAQLYSWWDYREQAWDRNRGLRIDHLLLSPEAVDLLVDAGIDSQQRGVEKPSDHAPVWCEVSL